MAKVLMFHRILPERLTTKPNAYSNFGTLISQEYFEMVLLEIIENGFQFVRISELLEQPQSGKLVALTFDDGYLDNWEFALPSLQKFNATATFYPVVKPCRDNSVLPLDTYYQCVDEMQLTDDERVNYITGEIKKRFYWIEPEHQEFFITEHFRRKLSDNRVSYMGSEHIKNLVVNGHEVGSHSMTHSLFTADYMNTTKINFELTQSKAYLEEITGKTVTSFCFPSGYYTSASIELAKEAGYTSVSLIKKNSKDEVLALPAFERVFVKPNSIENFRNVLLSK